MLGLRLNTIHNLWYFSDFMRHMRNAIEEGTFTEFRAKFYSSRTLATSAGNVLD
jgi:queuine tRNA-ribosyltransferase